MSLNAMSDEERKAYNRDKSARFRERQRIRMAEDPEYAAEVKAKRAIQDRNKQKRLECDPEFRVATNANNRASHARRMIENPDYAERKRDSSRRWYAENPEKASESYRKWYENNDRSEYNLEWSRANKDKRCESSRRRKALLRGATTVEIFTKTEIYERDKGICYLGGKPVNPDPSKWHLEHIIPLSKGGQHIRSNVAVSCPPCNLSKSDKLLTQEVGPNHGN